MKKMSFFFSGDTMENTACAFTCVSFFSGILALRCFLHSRFVAGGFFLFVSVVCSVAYTSTFNRIREPTQFLRTFFLLGKSFSTVMVPSLVFMHSAGFHPFWILSGTVLLISGNAALARSNPFGGEKDVSHTYDTVVLCQLIMLPLFVLLYYTNLAVYAPFVWGYPLYSFLVPFFLRYATELLSGRIFSILLAIASTIAVSLGLLSEYIF